VGVEATATSLSEAVDAAGDAAGDAEGAAGASKSGTGGNELVVRGVDGCDGAGDAVGVAAGVSDVNTVTVGFDVATDPELPFCGCGEVIAVGEALLLS
jgi:hypothetical protein